HRAAAGSVSGARRVPGGIHVRQQPVRAALLALAGVVTASALAAAPARKPATPGDLSANRRSAIVTAAQRVSPAVVSVSVVSSRVVRTDPFGGMLHDEFFERFYPPFPYRE